MKNKKNKIFLLISIFLMNIIFTNLVFASDNSNYEGFSYNLYTLEEESKLENISIVQDEEELLLNVTKDGFDYNITATKTNQKNTYETYLNINGKDYFFKILEKDNNFSGLLREIDYNKNLKDCEQFGFLISKDSVVLNTYSDSIRQDKQLSTVIHKNINSLENNYSVASIPTGSKHAYAESWLKRSFGEIWANTSTPTTSGRYVTVTHYNIKIGVIGDRVDLRKYNTSTSSTLYASPSSPPLGLQEVNKQYLIESNYSAAIEVSVTGLYDVNGLPLPVPMIFADSTAV